MAKQYNYKGKIIKNVPYGNEPRWFIYNEDGTKDEKHKYPERTLREAKITIDNLKGSEKIIKRVHGWINEPLAKRESACNQITLKGEN